MSQLHEAQRRADPIRRYVAPESLEDALEVLAAHAGSARAIAGGTDLLLELSRGARTGIDTLIDLSVLEGLDTIAERGGRIELGPLVTHGDVVGFQRMLDVGLPLAQACLEVGGPQLRNRATIVGNIVTASPANDTISALYALGADVTVSSAGGGDRTVPIEEFFTGFRATALEPGELVTRISFDALGGARRGVFVKLGLRRAQAISVVHAAAVVTDAGDGTVADLVVALGSVGPTIELVEAAAGIARGRLLADAAPDVAAAARAAVTPIDDLRSTAEYRSRTIEVVVERALRSLAAGTEAATWPQRPPRLVSADRAPAAASPPAPAAASPPAPAAASPPAPAAASPPAPAAASPPAPAAASPPAPPRRARTDDDAIVATVNGVERAAANAAGRTLLDWLRLDLGLTGTKEGCAEGECGACTVHLDGRAVLACLVPAARAEGASITTVEGIAEPGGALHPIQQALADCGGVQCGFCTPGFVMSAAMLAVEEPNPSRDQVEHGLSGNLCRCTGYYSIIDALLGDSRKAASGDEPTTCAGMGPDNPPWGAADAEAAPLRGGQEAVPEAAPLRGGQEAVPDAEAALLGGGQEAVPDAAPMGGGQEAVPDAEAALLGGGQEAVPDAEAALLGGGQEAVPDAEATVA